MNMTIPSGKNVILFDLGGVLVDLHMQKTFDAFSVLGFPNFHKHFDSYSGSSFIEDFEEGKINPETFLDIVKGHCAQNVTDQQIITAWNAMLGPLPEHKVEFLKNCKDQYKVYLYSNTNIIHVTYLISYYNNLLGIKVFESLFDKIYYSYELGIRKPKAEGYKQIMQENNITPQEIFYIDDGTQHVTTARSLGIETVLWKMNDPF